MVVFEILAIIAALIGGVMLVLGMINSYDSAPALAALAAVAIGVAVIPYCFVSILQRRQLRVDIDRLERGNRPDGAHEVDETTQ
jgi:amino acid transporter